MAVLFAPAAVIRSVAAKFALPILQKNGLLRNAEDRFLWFDYFFPKNHFEIGKNIRFFITQNSNCCPVVGWVKRLKKATQKQPFQFLLGQIGVQKAFNAPFGSFFKFTWIEFYGVNLLVVGNHRI